MVLKIVSNMPPGWVGGGVGVLLGFFATAAFSPSEPVDNTILKTALADMMKSKEFVKLSTNVISCGGDLSVNGQADRSGKVAVITTVGGFSENLTLNFAACMRDYNAVVALSPSGP